MRIMLWDGDRYPFVTTLESFLESNAEAFSPEEVEAVSRAAKTASLYEGGGGAGGDWAICGDPRTLPSLYDAEDGVALGWGLFHVGAPLTAMRDDQERHGFHAAWAHRYAEGFDASKNPPKDGGLADMDDPNRYAQFSGAWEAFGDGWNDATALFHDSHMLAHVPGPKVGHKVTDCLRLETEGDRVVLASDLRERITTEAQEGEPAFDVMRWLVDALAFVLAAPLGQAVAFPSADVSRVVRSSLED